MSERLQYLTVILFMLGCLPKTFNRVLSVRKVDGAVILETRFGPTIFPGVVKIEVIPTDEFVE